MADNALQLYLTYFVSTPFIKVENTRHFPSVDVVARKICNYKHKTNTQTQ
jgi:hypothetical protein